MIANGVTVLCPQCGRETTATEIGLQTCATCSQVFYLTAEIYNHAPKAFIVQTSAPMLAPAPEPSNAAKVIKYLRGITGDGVLSTDEIWNFGRWINRQSKQLCSEWPAAMLIPILNDIFADGEVTENEMMRLAQAIADIEAEWKQRKAFGRPPEMSARIESTETPELPIVDYSTLIESSDGEDHYTVNLHNLTCTCPDFVGKRAYARPRDYKRLCKHLVRLYRALEIPDEIKDDLFGAFLDDHYMRGKGTHPLEDWFLERVDGKKILYGYSSENPWVNVFAPQGGFYERFGFNRIERRWSYSESPEGFALLFRQKFAP